MTAVVAVLAAVVGALLGALVTYWLQRPRPAVIVDGIALSNDFPSESKPCDFDRDLIETLVNFGPNIPPIGEVKPGSTEKQWVDALKSAQNELQMFLNMLVPSLESALENLRSSAIARDGDRFQAELAEHGPNVFMQTAIADIHGKYSVPSKAYASGFSVQEIHEAPDARGSVIGMSGPRTIALVIPKSQVNVIAKVRVPEISKRLAQLIVHHDFDALLPWVEFLLRDIKERKAAWTSAMAEIERQLAPLARVCVQGVLSNGGRSPISFTNRAGIVINVKGFAVGAAQWHDDVDIPLKLGSQQEILVDPEGQAFQIFNNANPITVAPGKSIRFMAVADRSINELENGSDLKRCFDGGDRLAYLTASAVLPKSPNGSAIHSSSVLFRDVQLQSPLPRRGDRPRINDASYTWRI